MIFFEKIKDLPLNSICAKGTEITDVACESFRSMKRLKDLDISNTNITDEGLIYLLNSSIINLSIYECYGISDLGLRTFRSKNFNCRIHR